MPKSLRTKANNYCKNCFNDKLVTISNGRWAMSDSTRNRNRAVITSSTYNDALSMIYLLIVLNTDIPLKAVLYYAHNSLEFDSIIQFWWTSIHLVSYWYIANILEVIIF